MAVTKFFAQSGSGVRRGVPVVLETPYPWCVSRVDAVSAVVVLTGVEVFAVSVVCFSQVGGDVFFLVEGQWMDCGMNIAAMATGLPAWVGLWAVVWRWRMPPTADPDSCGDLGGVWG